MAVILAGILAAIMPMRPAIMPRRSRIVLRMACPPCVAACAPACLRQQATDCPAILFGRQHDYRTGGAPSSTMAHKAICRTDNPGCTMPEADTEGQRFAAATPQATPGFFLKGSHQLDWGMKNRLARVFDPRTGRTVMLAIDHGYFQGPTTGLERIDLSIVPLLPSCDALFCTRGILRSVIPAESTKPMVLRASGGPSILKELSDEQIAMDMEDALRLNAAGIGIQVFIGGEFESRP